MVTILLIFGILCAVLAVVLFVSTERLFEDGDDLAGVLSGIAFIISTGLAVILLIHSNSLYGKHYDKTFVRNCHDVGGVVQIIHGYDTCVKSRVTIYNVDA